MTEQLYHGLKQIARRLGLSETIVRRLISRGLIRAFKIDTGKNAAWCSTESEICEDIKSLPQKTRVNR